jgi:hypothetical protein
MGTKNFKPDKPAKITGGVASTFASAVNESNSKGSISSNDTADAWAKHVNQIDWESPISKTDNPNDDIAL